MVEARTPKAPDPDNGLKMAIGKASAGKPTKLVKVPNGWNNNVIAPLARNMPTATRMATK